MISGGFQKEMQQWLERFFVGVLPQQVSKRERGFVLSWWAPKACPHSLDSSFGSAGGVQSC
jgi:hypothetical protein